MIFSIFLNNIIVLLPRAGRVDWFYCRPNGWIKIWCLKEETKHVPCVSKASHFLFFCDTVYVLCVVKHIKLASRSFQCILAHVNTYILIRFSHWYRGLRPKANTLNIFCLAVYTVIEMHIHYSWVFLPSPSRLCDQAALSLCVRVHMPVGKITHF